MSTDVRTFITARLDKDEEVAQSAITLGGYRNQDGRAHRYSGAWRTLPHAMDEGRVEDAVSREVIVYNEGSPAHEEAVHIARFDPARVRREVEAKRLILAMHVRESLEGDVWCRTCTYGTGEDYGEVVEWPCPTLRALAAPYSDHRDFIATWSLAPGPPAPHE